MVQKSELETEVMGSEMAEDSELNREKNKHLSSHEAPDSTKFQRQLLIFGGIGVLVIVLALFFMGWHELTSIKVRLDQMERKLAQLEDMDEKVSGLNKAMLSTRSDLKEHIEKFKKWLEERFQGIDELQKRAAPPAMKTQAPPDLSKEPIPQTNDRYHEVRQGENLYKIARKYGLSVGELRRLNDIRPNQILQPGQKLLVAPEKNQ
jgi:LysM repeat protein